MQPSSSSSAARVKVHIFASRSAFAGLQGDRAPRWARRPPNRRGPQNRRSYCPLDRWRRSRSDPRWCPAFRERCGRSRWHMAQCWPACPPWHRPGPSTAPAGRRVYIRLRRRRSMPKRRVRPQGSPRSDLPPRIRSRRRSVCTALTAPRQRRPSELRSVMISSCRRCHYPRATYCYLTLLTSSQK